MTLKRSKRLRSAEVRSLYADPQAYVVQVFAPNGMQGTQVIHIVTYDFDNILAQVRINITTVQLVLLGRIFVSGIRRMRPTVCAEKVKLSILRKMSSTAARGQSHPKAIACLKSNTSVTSSGLAIVFRLSVFLTQPDTSQFVVFCRNAFNDIQIVDDFIFHRIIFGIHAFTVVG